MAILATPDTTCAALSELIEIWAEDGWGMIGAECGGMQGPSRVTIGGTVLSGMTCMGGMGGGIVPVEVAIKGGGGAGIGLRVEVVTDMERPL